MKKNWLKDRDKSDACRETGMCVRDGSPGKNMNSEIPSDMMLSLSESCDFMRLVTGISLVWVCELT